MISQEIIDILNKDEVARNLRDTFEKALETEGKDFTEQEKQDARQLMMMMAIQQNQEAMDLMAETVYNDLRNS